MRRGKLAEREAFHGEMKKHQKEGCRRGPEKGGMSRRWRSLEGGKKKTTEAEGDKRNKTGNRGHVEDRENRQDISKRAVLSQGAGWTFSENGESRV